MNHDTIEGYSKLLRQVKQRVALAQQRAIFAANEELLRMYWDLGHILYKTQNAEGWGKGTLARLSADMVRPIAQPSVSQLQGNTVELHNNTITQPTVLPNDLRSSLPSIEDIEAEFDDDKEK